MDVAENPGTFGSGGCRHVWSLVTAVKMDLIGWSRLVIIDASSIHMPSESQSPNCSVYKSIMFLAWSESELKNTPVITTYYHRGRQRQL